MCSGSDDGAVSVDEVVVICRFWHSKGGGEVGECGVVEGWWGSGSLKSGGGVVKPYSSGTPSKDHRFFFFNFTYNLKTNQIIIDLLL